MALVLSSLLKIFKQSSLTVLLSFLFAVYRNFVSLRVNTKSQEGFHDNDILLQGEDKDDNIMAVAFGLSRVA